MHLLGYSTDFATVECLNLMVSENFIEKRFGYLALNMLLDETHPMFFMATNSLQRDLDSASERIICLALSTLADIGSEDMCRDLNERVL
jgi:AP-1 complex subunit gamma-1|mmetsp:Transcript_29357/g.5305  ORF Transcript_29357/g.5305 Transcript_29357/m.5305 type:complete len:89 (+) Transcript_29357:153-419(+)